MSNTTPIISIVVPIHNVSEYLERCLHSLVNQTLDDIEIVCVDDYSTDTSKNIIDKYASTDRRIKSIYLEKNLGTCVARKRGVLGSKGEYILFCDGDDELSPNTCQIVLDEMKKKPVDILHFGTKTNFCGEYSDNEKTALFDVIKPYLKMLQGDICKACFNEHKFSYTLWNKAYNGEVCRKAFSDIAEEYAIVSEDLYTFFLISYFAHSYRGIEKKLYIYNFGRGITGGKYLNYEQFKKQCNSLSIINLLKIFLEKECAEKQYYNYYYAIKKKLIEDSLYQWRFPLSISDASAGYQLLLDILGSSTVVAELARIYWDDQVELLRRLSHKKTGLTYGKPVKRLGVYYHRMRNGGVEKVLSELLPLWLKLGYTITLFTDEESTDEDYAIPSDIERIVVPSFVNAIGPKYKRRARFWESVIKKYGIDTILYNSSTCHILFWDVCLLKSLGCNLVVQTHSMFSGAMWYSPIYASFLPLIYRMVDCTVSLSRVDVNFWKNYCPAYYIQNPISLIPDTCVSSLKSKNVLWVGRFSEEKQPFAILEIFSIVLKKIPDATLTLVGDGDSPQWIKQLKNKADELRIDNNIEFCGFQLDVTPYYKNASVFAFTSMCEAAPVVLSESMSYGIPIVMFELPNVESTRNSNDIIKIPQKDVVSFANKVIWLLENEEKRSEIGFDVRKNIEKFAEFDVANAWSKLFYDIEHGLTYQADENTSIMLDLLFENMYRGGNLLIASNSYNNQNPYEVITSRHEEVINRHEEVVNRHEEVINRHEEVVNRHEASINHQWEVQKWHEERLIALENKKSMWHRVIQKLRKYK